MATTARGVPYPVPGDPDNVPVDLHALAAWVDAHAGVAPFTTTQRGALTGADLWDERVIFNLTTGLLEQYDADTDTWSTVVTPSALIARKSHSPQPTETDYSTTSTTSVDVDATNLAVTFTAPLSGAVIVRLTATAQGESTVRVDWVLRDAGGEVAGTKAAVSTSGFSISRRDHSVLVTGLTPGNAYTWKWGHAAPTGGGTAHLYAGGTLGQALMEVWQA